MNAVISKPRPEISPYAPRIITMHVAPDKIREIGLNWKTINKIIDETDVKIDIEDDGTVFITAFNVEAGNKAVKMINAIVKEPEVGEVYMGKVIKFSTSVH